MSFCITARSGPSSPRGTGNTRMPSAARRAYSTDQPGSSTSTASPARASVRVTTSSAWVAPMVVTICSGAAGTPTSARRLDKARRSRRSPAGSPYCSDSGPSSAPVVTRRSALASIGRSSHSTGSVPRPGIGRPPGGWNMPRISVVALMGSGVRASLGSAARIGSGARSRT